MLKKNWKQVSEVDKQKQNVHSSWKVYTQVSNILWHYLSKNYPKPRWYPVLLNEGTIKTVFGYFVTLTSCLIDSNHV